MSNKIIWLALFVFSLFIMGFSTQKNRKVIFFGDSITEMGIQPGGYITKMKLLLQQQNITNYELLGAGISGNKVYDLYLRLEDDVLAKNPDIVVIYIGVNDVWHKVLAGTGTDMDKFEKFYRAIIKKLQANNIKVVLATPAAIGEKKDGDNKQDKDLDGYGYIVKKIGQDLSLPVCDLRSYFINYEAANNANNTDRGLLTTDGVHLNDKGTDLVATELWNVIKEVK
ncbi:MAG: G-D-S-L family lipolytic protein [Sphingobacteriia bacterium]|nr:G-D-S-L family lipolytic protein [Sphingobacteriia bacterium]